MLKFISFIFAIKQNANTDRADHYSSKYENILELVHYTFRGTIYVTKIQYAENLLTTMRFYRSPQRENSGHYFFTVYV